MNESVLIEKKSKVKNFIRAPEKKDIIGLIMLLVLQRTNIFGIHPFGCVFFSAVVSPGSAYLGIPIIFISSLLSGASVLKYTAAALIIWMSDVLLYIKNEKNIPRLIICMLAVFICGTGDAFGGGIYAFAKLTGEVLLCGMSYPVFFNLKSVILKYERNEASQKEEKLSLIMVLLVFMWGLEGINLPFGISVKYVFMIFAILSQAMYLDIPQIATFALLVGFLGIFDMPASLIAGSILAISASFAGLFKCYRRLAVTVGFLSGISVCVLIAGNTQFLPIGLLEIFTATALFNVLPDKISKKIGMFFASSFKTEERRRDIRLKEYLKEELSGFSNTFYEFGRQFKNTFQKGTQNKEAEITDIFDETAARVCRDCRKNNICWSKEFNDTYRYMFEIMKICENEGFCDVTNAPVVFLEKCQNQELFLSEFNHVYEMRKQEFLRDGMRVEDRAMISSQYSEISKIIKELSEEIEGSFFFDEQKEQSILRECSKEGIYIRDLNVIRNRDGYFEVFFAPGMEEDIEIIANIASEILGIKMKKGECRNKAIQKLVADNVFSVSVTVEQKKRDTENISGDTLIHFETVRNKYYIILCDGMGSGYDANKESRMTAELLGGFLKAGFSKEAAVSLINSTLALKMEREGFSTIDICEIDLRSGQTEFIKVGGVQSYIKNKNIIETVTSSGLPAGIIENIETKSEKYISCAGDRIVMVSDGVSEAGYGMMRGEWIKKIMNENLSEEEMCKKILYTAQNKIYPRTPDDMTVCVIGINMRNDEEEELEKAM